jgi:hypothetical protein
VVFVVEISKRKELKFRHNEDGMVFERERRVRRGARCRSRGREGIVLVVNRLVLEAVTGRVG